MSHNKYISIIATAGIVSWISWIVVINKLNVFESMGISLLLFFLSLSIALICTFTIIGFYFRVWLNKNEIYYHHIQIAFRQSILLTLMVIGAMFFQILRILTWWSGGLLILTILLIELYFISKDPY